MPEFDIGASYSSSVHFTLSTGAGKAAFNMLLFYDIWRIGKLIIVD
jgi:hypothetical protein